MISTHFVFDFGRVLFDWQPERLLRQLLPERALDAASADVPMFYLSNMPAPFAEHLEREHAFVRDFDDGVFSARVNLIKPDPAIFALAAKRFGLAPAELVFLEDHPANVAAAHAAGWRSLLFSDAAQCEQDLRQAGWWPQASDQHLPG